MRRGRSLVRRGRPVVALAAALILGFGAQTQSQAASPDQGPRLATPRAVLEDALRCPAKMTRPPVLLVHGTSVTASENWSWNYAKALPQFGFDVCTVDMPDRLLADIQTSTEYVVHAIRRVHQMSHRKVDVVGLSQGAIQPRWALRFWPDLRNRVDDYVSMAGTNHGSVFADAACAAGSCIESLWQQRTSGSEFQRVLNAGDTTPGRVSFTSVYSLSDEIIQPVAPTPVASIVGAVNIAVQDICPGRYVGHAASAADAAYFAVVIDALSHGGAASPSRVDRHSCTQLYMPHVDPVEATTRTAEIYVIASTVQAQHSKAAAEPPLRAYARGSQTTGS